MNGEFWRKHWYKLTMGIVSAVLLVAIAFVYLGGSEPDFPVEGPAADFELTDIQGETVSMQNTSGKVRLLYFFFANCPDVCPPTTHMLSRVQERLQEEGVFGTEATILQITVDPERDTPEVLRQYAANFNADLDAWRFLRGTEAEIAAIGEDYNMLIRKDESTGLYIHSNVVYMIDGDNQIRKRFVADDLNDELIANDVMALLNE